MGNAAYYIPAAIVGDGWSLTNNPCGNWSYGTKPTKMGIFTLFNTKRTDGWNMDDNDSNGNIWRNYTTGTPYNVLPGQITIHPPYNAIAWTAIRWTAFADDTVNVRGYFGAGDTGYMSYSIIHNNTEICFDQHLVYTTENFNFNISVKKGDTLDFQVGDTFMFGNTPVEITVGDEYFNDEATSSISISRVRKLQRKVANDYITAKGMYYKTDNGFKRVNL